MIQETANFKVEQKKDGFRIVQKTRNPYRVLDLTYAETKELLDLIVLLTDKTIGGERKVVEPDNQR